VFPHPDPSTLAYMWKGTWYAISMVALVCAVACGDDDEGGKKPNPAQAGTSGSSGRGGDAGAANGSGGEGGDTRSMGLAGEQGTAGEPAIHGSFLPEFESGTRIAVKQYQSNDMPPVFLSFYDTELETECAFVDVDGTLRCMPSEGGIFREALFADTDCSEGV